MPLTFDEIKTQVDYDMLKKLAKGLNVFPSQLFTFDEIKKDREFKDLHEILEENKTLKTNNESYLKEKDNFAKKIKEFTDKDNLNSAKMRFGELVKGMKLNDSEKSFIETKFNIDKVEDFSDDGLNKYVESKRNEYKLIEPVFKKNTNTPIFQPGNNIPADLDDFTKAANNPLLDSDFNPYQNG
jgi:transcriptional regulator with XRE-family HTH domain